MEIANIIMFINKTISKTLAEELCWNVLPNDFDVKFLPSQTDSILDDINPFSLSRIHSFMSPYKSGHILLLVYEPEHSFLPISPPDGCFLSLRMQDEHSQYPVEIINSDTLGIDSSLLLRLYNLVVNKSSTVHSLIDDFLNS